MKVWIGLLGICLFLSGCSRENRELAEAMEFRDTLLSGTGCAFTAEVTADYGDALHTFAMDCQADGQGKLTFEITAPESISGIRGTIAEDGGNILFEEDALYFPLLTDDQLIPASAPWIFLRTLRGGCLTAVCREEALLHITADDSFREDALTMDIWLEENIPIRGDILWNGKRILSLNVEKFVIS